MVETRTGRRTEPILDDGHAPSLKQSIQNSRRTYDLSPRSIYCFRRMLGKACRPTSTRLLASLSFIHMRSSLSLASLSLALGATAAPWSDGSKYGNMFYSGPTSNAYITKATYSVVPPDTPCNYHTGLPQEELSLWVGVQADPTNKDVMDMNLVQPLVTWPPNQSLT